MNTSNSDIPSLPQPQPVTSPEQASETNDSASSYQLGLLKPKGTRTSTSTITASTGSTINNLTVTIIRYGSLNGTWDFFNNKTSGQITFGSNLQPNAKGVKAGGTSSNFVGNLNGVQRNISY